VSELVIRQAARTDLPALGRLGAMLMRAHYAFDQQRFMNPGDSPEEGYAWFLGTQLRSDDAVIFVAERDDEVLGYVWAALEPQSWKDLREAAGFIHDLAVDERGRRSGIATALVDAATDWLRRRGMPRVVLGTAERNAAAQALFTRLGFRRTMVEMTREL
jgi:ribosomal protein S18 acetylase RimI-like enzyme